MRIVDTGLWKSEPYAIIDENGNVLAHSVADSQSGIHTREGLEVITSRIAALEAQNARLVEALEKRQDIKRFTDAYDFLVDETENRATIYNKIRYDRLSDLLELFEYLRGEDEENPLDKWFPQ